MLPAAILERERERARCVRLCGQKNDTLRLDAHLGASLFSAMTTRLRDNNTGNVPGLRESVRMAARRDCRADLRGASRCICFIVLCSCFTAAAALPAFFVAAVAVAFEASADSACRLARLPSWLTRLSRELFSCSTAWSFLFICRTSLRSSATSCSAASTFSNCLNVEACAFFTFFFPDALACSTAATPRPIRSPRRLFCFCNIATSSSSSRWRSPATAGATAAAAGFFF